MRGSLVSRSGLVRRQSFSLRYRIHAPDGGVRHLHKQWVAHYDSAGHAEHMLGVVADETPLETLVLSRGVAGVQLQMAEELTGLAFWHQDVLTGEVHLNSHAERLFDVGPQAGPIALRRMRMGPHPDDRVAVAAADAAAMAGGKPVDVELRHRTADGGWRLLLTRRGVQSDARGRIVSLVGVALDASDSSALGAWNQAGLRDTRARNRLLARVTRELRTPMDAVLGFAQLLSYQDGADPNPSPARRRAVGHITDAGQHLWCGYCFGNFTYSLECFIHKASRRLPVLWSGLAALMSAAPSFAAEKVSLRLKWVAQAQLALQARTMQFEFLP